MFRQSIIKSRILLVFFSLVAGGCVSRLPISKSSVLDPRSGSMGEQFVAIRTDEVNGLGIPYKEINASCRVIFGKISKTYQTPVYVRVPVDGKASSPFSISCQAPGYADETRVFTVDNQSLEARRSEFEAMKRELRNLERAIKNKKGKRIKASLRRKIRRLRDDIRLFRIAELRPKSNDIYRYPSPLTVPLRKTDRR